MKKTLSILLALCMVLTLALPVMAGAEEAREHVTIRYAQFGNSTDDVEGMANDPIKKAIEEKLNITLEYDTGTDGFIDRMTTELYTGTAAELFPSFAEAEKIAKYAEEDLIWDLAAIVNADPARYPTLAKIMNAPEYKAYNKMYTGDAEKAYAIYSIFAFDGAVFGGVPAYNTAILNEVNEGKVPATVDEFIEFCNKAAAAGYVAWWPRNDKLTNWTYFDQTLALPQGTAIAAPNGDLWAGCIMNGTLGTDETWTIATTSETSKEVVKQLAALYTAGALDNSIGIKGDFDDAYADFAAGKIASADFGFGFAGQYRDFWNNPWAAANPEAKHEDLTLGTALTKDGAYGKVYSSLTWPSYHYFVPTSCAYPERVLDLVEFLASAEGQDLVSNTTNYVYNAETDADYWAACTAPYGYGDGRCKYVWFSCLFSGGEYEVDFTNREWWDAVMHPIDNSANWSSESDKQLYQYAYDVIQGFVNDEVVTMPLYYTMVSLPSEAADIRAKLAGITNEYLTQMIGGTMDIETGWADYQAAYEAAGAAQLQDMINTAVAAARDAQ
ncbi:MAG: hypothetical protein Q4G19_05430 [Clostridia bacterium]|nr:hypothetical protein [Clostridia bacterium]